MIFKHEAKTSRAALLAGVLGMSIAGFAASAAAQSTGEQSAPAVEDPEAVQELRAKQQEIRQLMGELRQIQQEATQADPELAAQQEDYQDLVMENMKGENFDPQAEVDEMRSLRAELQSGGDLAEEERQSKMQELRTKQQQFQQKQQEAMQTEDVRAARQELDEEMTAAMTELNSDVEAMIAQLQQLRQEYQSLLQEAMADQQG